MSRSLLLVFVLACGGTPPPSASPADPTRAPPPTGTQAAGAPEAPAVDGADAARPAENEDLAVACQQALEAHPPGEAAPGGTASELNTLGYRCYRAGRLPEAAHLFSLALRADEAHALAHYNLACTLALLRRQGRVCEHDATVDAILRHLERAVALDPKRRQRMREDSDLDAVRDTARYRILDRGRQPGDAAVRALVSGLTFHSPPQGAFGSLATLTLEGPGDGGAASVARVRVRTLTDAGVGAPRELTGVWEVWGGRVTVKLPDPAPGGGAWSLSPTGDLVDTSRSGLSAIGWFGTAAECDA